MAIEDKALFVKTLEKEIEKITTAENTRQVLCAVTTLLDGFELKATAQDRSGKDDLLDAYLSAMRVQGRSASTLERYRYLITRMMDHARVPTRHITVYHLRSYLAAEKERGIADRTLEGMRQVFSAYFNWLSRERLIDVNPVSNLGTFKYQKKVKEVYSEADIERMKLGCDSLRDRGILLFLASTGCRVSEMTGLNRDSINFASLECVVLGKGNKERTVYLNAFAAETIQRYLEQRTDRSEALFAGKNTGRISPAGVRRMLRKLEEKTQTHHVHPHKFRRTLATNLIRHGMAIQEVAAILGHDRLDTTMEYVLLDKQDVKNAYRRYA